MLTISKTDKTKITETYLICNTPRSLYNTFRANSAVQGIANSFSTQDIIDSFIKLGGNGIDNIEDLAFAYALYISLTFKDYDDVFTFYADKGKINFEWFPDIANIYLSSHTYTNQYILTTDNFKLPPSSIVEKQDFIESNKWENHEISF